MIAAGVIFTDSKEVDFVSELARWLSPPAAPPPPPAAAAAGAAGAGAGAEGEEGVQSALMAECAAAVEHRGLSFFIYGKEDRSGYCYAEPTPATHAILTQLKAGDTVHQAGELPKTH